jgi:DNA topoisomerase-2
MTAHISQKFKKLDEISHVLLRPGRYIGSINPHTAVSYTIADDKHKMISDELTWCPALLKIFDEIISNSVDYSKTDSGTHLDTIKVNVDKTTGAISVYDNGGIVVVKHPEHDQYIPEMIFELRAGSNFNDDEDSTLTGQNGEGAALTSIFSTSFIVDTADGKNKFLQTHTNNSRDKTTPIIKKSKEHYTKITFIPDYPKLNLENLSDGDFRKIEKRVYDVAGCNPQLKIYFNDKKIDIKNFEDYIKMYVDEYIYDQNDNWKVGISKSDGGFSHVSFVNSTETTIGGLHVSYIADQIIFKLREFIEKKHKIQIKPSEIKNHLN